MKAREVKRAKLVAKYAEKKAALKAAGDYEAYQALQRIPKTHHTSVSTTAARSPVVQGFMRQFGLSRIQFREMASAGLIPGVKKASW